MVSLYTVLLIFEIPLVAQAYLRTNIAVANLSSYPGYTGDISISGTVTVEETTSGIILGGTVVGLNSDTSGGIHIHEGVSCESTSDVGGHYYDDMAIDPWTTMWYSDTNGVSSISLTLNDFTLGGEYPVAGRAMVVHDEDGNRVGCGLLQSISGEIIDVGPYSGYEGAFKINGTLIVTQTDSSISIYGTMGGLEANAIGGYHIHEGYTCKNYEGQQGPGGHYYDGMDSDPWTTTYESNGNGYFDGSLNMDTFSLYDSYPVAYRAFVIHLSDGTRAGCGIIGTPTTAVATLGAYPDYTGTYDVEGTVAVTNSDTGIVMTATVTGLPVNENGGFHIHSGVSCDDQSYVGGHYYEDMSSDPWTTTYTSDANGIASVSLALADFSLSGSYPVAGRTIVLHDGDGTRIACGLIKSTPGEVVSISDYPSYNGDYHLNGTILITQLSGGINISGTLGGLEASTTGGFHIHSGYTCDDADGVGGHYFEGMSSDPWTNMWVSDSQGAYTFTTHMDEFSLYNTYPTAFRAFVVHTSDGIKAGCGLIGTPTKSIASLVSYPSYTGDLTVNGTIGVFASSSGIEVVGTIVGLTASTSGGIHIHSGFTCDDADSVGGHYYDGMSVDPWTTYWYSDINGVSSIAFTMDNFSLGGDYPVAGRAVVIHDEDGARVACGLLQSTSGEFVTLSAYPGVNNNNVTGTLLVSDLSSSIIIDGTLGGLEASQSGGIHIHEGYTVDDADGVGGHYYDGMSSDPWTTKWYSDANGYASISKVVADFSIISSYPVAYRAVVVHASGGGRVAAGLISTSSVFSTAIDDDDDDDDSSSKKKNDKKKGGMMIVIIIVVVVILLIGIAAGIWCIRKRSQKSTSQKNLTTEERSGELTEVNQAV